MSFVQSTMKHCYSGADLHHVTKHWDDGEFSLSEFDRLLRGRWDAAMKAGHFRYQLDKLETKFIGKKKYVAQLNVKRATERRKPQEITLVNQPFDPNIFNFTKIKSEEILFQLMKDHEADEKQTENDTKCNGETAVNEEKNLVIVNVSPLEYGHVLIVPDIDAFRPQVLTEYCIQLAIESVLLSHHHGFKVGFNSLCAFSSVNHQHLHAFYLEHELFIESCPVTHLKGRMYLLDAMPCKGFAFQLEGSSVSELSRVLFLLCDHLQKSEVAHNLLLMRGAVFGENRDSRKRTVRIFLWPRKKFIGVKEEAAFNVAVVELGGHLPIKVTKLFENLTEESVEKTMFEAALEEEEFQKLTQQFLQIYEPSHIPS